MKTEVYTWRVSPEVKSALESEARREKVSVAVLLDQLTRRWLEERRSLAAAGDDGQARLHAQSEKAMGKIAGKNPRRAESARTLVREALARKHDRRLPR